MSVLEDLTEEECYLACILADESGIDQAEMFWTDEGVESPNGLWRAWPFQWKWYNDTSQLQIEQLARSLGKSVSITLRAFAFPFVNPGQEMVITAPELNHLQPITGLVEKRFKTTRMGREMLPKRAGNGITHRPFEMNFLNGARILGRIPQRDGSGIKGCEIKYTLVLTRVSGWKFIQDVTTDDYVWSHENRWSKVAAVQSFEAETFRVKGQGSFEKGVSEGHGFYVRNDVSKMPGKVKRDLGPLKWERVNNLSSSKYSPINSYWSSPKSFDEVEVVYPDFSGNKNNTIRNCESESFWWLVGRYLADGCLSGLKGEPKRRVDLFVHPKDQNIVFRHLNRLNWNYNVTKRAHSSADRIGFSSAAVVTWLEKYFGKNADGKEIPTFCFTMKEEFRRALLEGYLSGDGNSTFHGTQDRISAGSASKKLAMGIGTIGATLGYHVGYSVVDIKVKEINGVKLKKKPFDSYRVRLNKHGDGYETDYFMHYKIRSVEPAGVQTVYNIISEDHSYLSDGVMSHNTHPLWLEQDESQDYPAPGWTEIIETLKSGTPGSIWRAHGVTRGVRDHFYKFTQPDSGWKVHKYSAMSRPNWTDVERQQKIKQYGSRNSPDYRRNVGGHHGDASSPLFVLARLMLCFFEGTSVHVDVNGEDITLPIEDVEVGSTVKNASGTGTVLANIESHHERLCKIVINGDELYCTPDHRIFTDRGWVEAQELLPGDYLYGPEDVRTLWESNFEGEPSQEILQQILHEGFQRNRVIE